MKKHIRLLDAFIAGIFFLIMDFAYEPMKNWLFSTNDPIPNPSLGLVIFQFIIVFVLLYFFPLKKDNESKK